MLEYSFWSVQAACWRKVTPPQRYHRNCHNDLCWLQADCHFKKITPISLNIFGALVRVGQHWSLGYLRQMAMNNGSTIMVAYGQPSGIRIKGKFSNSSSVGYRWGKWTCDSTLCCQNRRLFCRCLAESVVSTCEVRRPSYRRPWWAFKSAEYTASNWIW